MSDGPELFTYEQAAARLGISVSTLRKWVARGVMRHHRVGARLVRFTEEDLRSAVRLVEASPVDRRRRRRTRRPER